MKILDLLGFTKDEAISRGTLFDALSTLLEGYSEEEQVRITAVAGLLGKVAFSDQEISKEEEEVVRRILIEHSSLNKESLDRVVQLLTSVTEELWGIEDYRYARMFRERSNEEERKEIIRLLFQVAGVNGSISAEEEQAVRNVATELVLSRQIYLSIRNEFREQLDLLKGLP